MKILNWFRKVKKPKYKLVPDGDGTYTLEKYHEDVNLYLAEGVYLTKDKANDYIKNIERDILYYRED